MKDTLRQICPNCSTENAPDAKFCQQCGESLEIICPNCNESNDHDARFCKNCGTELKKTQDATASLDALRQSAPDELQAKVRIAMSQIEDERKPVTILFVDIVGSTSKAEKMDPEEWREVVTGAHRRLSEAVYQYEGTVAQLLGDGMLAFFGAPITHEDDPSRAIHAGLQIQRSIKEYGEELAGYVDNFQVRVGINTGTVVIGDVGEGMNVEYLAVGDAINVASRIESEASPGTVWLGEDCARLVGSEFELEDKGEIEVKGKAKELRLFEVVGLRSDVVGVRGTKTPASVYVGRERELADLKSALLELCRGHGQIVIIQGEAGIGKSRLVHELRTFADEYDVSEDNKKEPSFLIQPRELRWLEGRSLSYGSSLSFWAITKLLMADLGLKEDVAEARIEIALRKRVKDLFGEDAEGYLPFLIHLLGLKLKGGIAEQIKSLDGESLRRETLAAIYEYFARLAEEQPTILVFEDSHWADPSTIKALEILLPLADRAPLMILCPMRIERDHPSWNIHLIAETNFAHRYTLISLKKLSSSESTKMMDGLLGVTDLPERIREFVLKRSEGNPLYVEEVIQHLVERGYLQSEDGSWQATKSIDEIGVPDTLQGLLLARIDRQEEEVRRTLQLASVIGRSFMYRLLKAISEAERELDDHLSQLQRADLVREHARMPELEYIFKHSLTQEAAYNSLLIERRKEFHAKVGESIERLFDERAEELTGLLAHHWERAGNSEKAVEYLLLAGERARRLHAHLEALGYYDRALDLMPDESEDYSPTLNQRAHVLLELFRGKEAVRDFEELQDSARKRADQIAELNTLLGLGRANYICALDETDIDFALRSKEYYQAAYELAKDLGDRAGMIKALVPTTWFSDFWPEYRDQAVKNTKEAFEISQELGDEDLLIESKLALANTMKLPEREQIGEELRSQLEQRNDLPRLNRILFRLMFTHLGLGNFQKCIETCNEGFEVADKIGVPPVQYATIKALALIRLGRFDEARSSLEMEVADDLHRFGKAFRDTGYGIYYLEMLAFEKARETLESSIEQAHQVGRAWLVNMGRYHLARTLLESEFGTPSEIETILSHFDPSDMFRALIFGKYAYYVGDYALALDFADKLIDHSRENSWRPDLSSSILLKAQALGAMGEPEASVEVAREGITLAAKLKYRPVLWRLHLNNATALMDLDREDESQREFQAASKVIRDMAQNISEESLRQNFLSNSDVELVLARTRSSPTEQV